MLMAEEEEEPVAQMQTKKIQLAHLPLITEACGKTKPYGCVPAPNISLLCPSATPGYAVTFRRRKSPGNSDRSSHSPAATAAAHVTVIIPSRSRSAPRLPFPDSDE